MTLVADSAEIIEAARRLGAALSAQGATVATAESCTGGLIAAALTELPGSSHWFERGFVTYSNAAKEELIGVPRALLDEYGAVSEPVAKAMAQGALARSRARLALSVTGVAGPGGGSPAKPVGTVCFAWAVAGAIGAGERLADGLVPVVETRHFAGDRRSVRAQTALYALTRALEVFAATGEGMAQAP